MNEIVGFIAAFLVTMAYMPQVVESHKTRKCDMSSSTLIALWLAMLLWCIYAFGNNGKALFTSSFISLVQISYLIYIKNEYGS